MHLSSVGQNLCMDCSIKSDRPVNDHIVILGEIHKENSTISKLLVEKKTTHDLYGVSRLFNAKFFNFS